MAQHPTRSLLEAIGETVAEIQRAARDGAVRAEAAFIRALVDELERFPTPRPSAVRDQLGEELMRLAELLGGEGPAPRLELFVELLRVETPYEAEAAGESSL